MRNLLHRINHSPVAKILLVFSVGLGNYLLWQSGAKPKPAPSSTIPWIATAKANCTAYNEQVNEIGKSAVFRSQKDFPVGQRLNIERGVLSDLRTDHGGDEVRVVVAVAGIRLKAKADRGSPLYEWVTPLREGQCVVVRATVERVDSLMERSVMCDLDYAATFESITSCH